MTRYVIDVPTLVHLVDHPPGPYRTRPLSRLATLSLRTITPPTGRPGQPGTGEPLPIRG